MSTPSTLSLSPLGHLQLHPGEATAAWTRIHQAFERGDGAGLFHLGASEVTTTLPADIAFWRDFGRAFVARACATSDLDARCAELDVPISAEDLVSIAQGAPPMDGGEYLNATVLAALWAETLQAFRTEASAFDGGVQALLSFKNPAWHVVGRVHLHLAENKRDPERPFAFLATFTTGLTPLGKPQHRALGDAVRESAAGGDRRRLLSLLSPVQRAGEKSALLKRLVDSSALFQPQAWTPSEAYAFLKEVPVLEESGVVVRVPNWWKPRQPPRARVTVTLGSSAPSALGLDALVDFQVTLAVGGEPLTESERETLLASASGLVLVKGTWVELDRGKLEAVLAHWRKVAEDAPGGVTFIEGMRLLAGASIGADPEPDEAREWMEVQAGHWLEEALGEARRGGDTVELGASLKAELRPYQREGVRWLWLLTRLRLGACLADDMGLGKTLQVLALLLLLKKHRSPLAPVGPPHLLVVPASLLANWKREAEHFAPSLRFFIAHPSVTDAKSLASPPLNEVDAVITSYGAAQRLPWVAARAWGLVVLDEAQAIKNAGTRQARAVKALKATSRVALTGTPVENHVGDLWSLFDFLNPGLLGSAKEFGAFVKRSQSYAPLRKLTRPYLLRRMKTDKAVIADLPEKTEVRAYCTLTKLQAALYQESVESLGRALREAKGMERRGLVLAYLMRFKQICNHPSQWLGDGRYPSEQSGKVTRLRELSETVASRQEKVLVFTQFQQLTQPLASWMGELFGRPGLVLTGQTAVKKRAELVKRFQEDEQVPFFVLSLKAGGTGLNLTAASHVIHFDRWWNPAVENQATDRAFRIGQKRSVMVHKFVCRGTVEERIDAMLEAKQGVAGELLSGEELRLTELGDKELLELVSLDLRQASAE